MSGYLLVVYSPMACSCPHGDKSTDVVDYKGKEQQPADEELSSMIFTNMREIAKAFFYKLTSEDSLKDSYVFNKMSRNFDQKDVLIFDPGGYGSNEQQTCVVDMFKDLIRIKEGMIKEGMLEEVAIIHSTGGQWGKLQLQKGIRTQGQDILEVQEKTDSVVSVINQQYAQSTRLV